jgi:perosamine synthetase
MIPVCEPTLNGNEKKYVADCMATGWISSGGKYVKQFEDNFSKFIGLKHGISCSNGTNALHLAVEALGIGKGDEVIVPEFTMMAVPNSVFYAGAIPITIDSESETWNMNPDLIEERITNKTKAIIIAPVYGHPADMDKIMKIAQKHNLKVIEDCAEVPGGTYNGKMCGTFGNIACFSFYGNKIITTGEGGMCLTDDDSLAEEMRKLKNHYFGTPRFLHDKIGYNYRMTNIQSAIGVAQLEYVDKLIQSRIDNAQKYNKLLAPLDFFNLPVQKKEVKNVYWMYGITIKDISKISKLEFMNQLKNKGIDTRSFFYPTSMQKAYTDNVNSSLIRAAPVAKKLYDCGFYLPSSSSLTDKEIETVVDKITEVIAEIK